MVSLPRALDEPMRRVLLPIALLALVACGSSVSGGGHTTAGSAPTAAKRSGCRCLHHGRRQSGKLWSTRPWGWSRRSAILLAACSPAARSSGASRATPRSPRTVCSPHRTSGRRSSRRRPRGRAPRPRCFPVMARCSAPMAARSCTLGMRPSPSGHVAEDGATGGGRAGERTDRGDQCRRTDDHSRDLRAVLSRW